MHLIIIINIHTVCNSCVIMELVLTTYVAAYKIIYYLVCIGQGIDYNSEPFNVTIPAGSVNASFEVAINDDNIFEQIEDFHLTIDQLSSRSGVIIGNPDRAVVNIFDNDRK